MSPSQFLIYKVSSLTLYLVSEGLGFIKNFMYAIKG